MLFHVTWEFEQYERRGTLPVTSGLPPLAGDHQAGAEFKGFYGNADGRGGVAIIEADSAATLARTTAPWTPWLRFTVTPIVPIEEATAIAGEAVAFRDTVKQPPAWPFRSRWGSVGLALGA